MTYNPVLVNCGTTLSTAKGLLNSQKQYNTTNYPHNFRPPNRKTRKDRYSFQISGSQVFSFDNHMPPWATKSSQFSHTFRKALSIHPLSTLQKLFTCSYRVYNSTIQQLLHHPPHPIAFWVFPTQPTVWFSNFLLFIVSPPTISPKSSLASLKYLIFEYISLPISSLCFFPKKNQSQKDYPPTTLASPLSSFIETFLNHLKISLRTYSQSQTRLPQICTTYL